MACRIPQPTPDQSALLLRCCAALVHRAVRREDLPLPELGDMHGWQVDGAFVSLHQGDELRSCCGIIGGPHPLPDCFKRAAWRAACDDPRFAPITEAELPGLNLEIHLLHGWRSCEVPAEARPAQVHIGRDGLVIRRGPSAGLLLPVVASNYGWDAVTFLDQCCAKAGLPSSAWHDDATALDIFQAHYLTADMRDL